MITFQKFNLKDYARDVIVTDKNVARIYGISGNNVFVLPQGEQCKSFRYAEKLCRFYMQRNLDRNSRVVALGGGCVGDVTGFAASVFKRGIKLLNIPTTLISQTDSAVGGKTAVDLDGVKNVVGTFYPSDVLIDVNFLKTLPAAELENGMGEIIKYRMLSSNIDEVFQRGDTEEIVRTCALFKQELCSRDPYDTGERRQLNLGHTLGHAMELTLKLSHGVAVSNGLYYETELACLTGLVSRDYADKWQSEIKARFKLYPLSKKILNVTVFDKKNSGGNVGFSLPASGGFCYKTFPLEKVCDILLND